MSNRVGTIIKAVTDLPARLYGGNAQEVEVSGLDYTLHLDIEKLPIAESSTAADKWTAVWDAAADTYSRVEFSNLPTPPTAWGAITGKPATFPPEAHTHAEYVAKAGDTMTGDLTLRRSAAPATGALYLGNTVASYIYSDGAKLRLGDNPVDIPSATVSTSTTTGALTVAGGVGVVGALNCSDFTIDHTSPTWVLKKLGVRKWGCNVGASDELIIYDADISAGVMLVQNATAWSAYSDISLKQNLQPQSVRERMRAGDYWFGSFDWKHDGHRGIGVTAQSVATVFPEWVDDIDGKLAVQEAKAGLAALAYAKEVDDELTELRKELKALRARVAELEGKAA